MSVKREQSRAGQWEGEEEKEVGIRWCVLSRHVYNSNISNTLPCAMNSNENYMYELDLQRGKMVAEGPPEGCVDFPCTHFASPQTHPAFPPTLQSRLPDEEAGSGLDKCGACF